MENKFEDWMKNSRVKKAYDFAKLAHEGQYRKMSKNGGKLDYFSHPEMVAELVYKLKNSKEIESLIIASLLHDVPEDTEHTLEEIREAFGELVFSLVEELTNDPIKRGNMSKEKYLIKKMLNMTSWGLVIKLCDRLHNIMSLELARTPEEIKFVNYYKGQTEHIIDALKKNRELTSTQKTIIEMIEDKLEKLEI